MLQRRVGAGFMAPVIQINSIATTIIIGNWYSKEQNIQNQAILPFIHYTMSILSINESFDPLFEEIWKMWAQGWDTNGGSKNEAYMNRFNKRFMAMLIERGDYFSNAINNAVVALRIYNRVVPNEEFEKINILVNELVGMVRKIEPDAKYITIELKSSVSGSDACLPVVEIHFDTEWFGRDYRTDKYGPWHEKHSTCCTHIRYDTANIQGYQGCKPDARPMPRYGELHPASTEWKKNDPWDHNIEREQDRHKFHIFFPDGERFVYHKAD